MERAKRSLNKEKLNNIKATTHINYIIIKKEQKGKLGKRQFLYFWKTL